MDHHQLDDPSNTNMIINKKQYLDGRHLTGCGLHGSSLVSYHRFVYRIFLFLVWSGGGLHHLTCLLLLYTTHINQHMLCIVAIVAVHYTHISTHAMYCCYC